MGCPFVKNAVQHARAARIGQEFSVIADQTTRWHMCHNTGLAAILLHLDQIALARACDFLNHRPCIFIIHIDSYFFDGF